MEPIVTARNAVVARDFRSLTRPMRVHCYGGGLQSLALLVAWSIDGECWDIPKPDLVLMADTRLEPREVYEKLEEVRNWCDQENVPFEIVEASDVDLLQSSTSGIFIPAYTIDLETGERGQLLRQCTGRFKIEPMMKRVEQLGGREVGAEMWLAITIDEYQRMKTAGEDSWFSYRHPLIWEVPGGGMTRHDALVHLRELYVEPASKSACIPCPYTRDARWLKMKRESPDEFEVACKFDERIRHMRPGFTCWLHESRMPLRSVEFRNERQEALFDLTTAVCDGGFCHA